MSQAQSLTTRSVLAALLTLALALALLVAVPQHAQAQEGAIVDRAAGPNRFATAAEISERTFTDPAQVDVVYLSTGGVFADALAAGAAAARLGGPVLLTARTVLPGPIRAEIERLDPDRVTIVGGEGAVGREVEDEIRALPGDIEVERIGGANRFATAGMIATDAWPEGAETVFIATGGVFADALAGVPAAALQDAPMLLVTGNDVTDATRQALQELDPDQVFALGGRSAISDDVLNEIRAMGPEVDRIAGSHRFATADQIALENFIGTREIFIATGEDFADALAGGAAVAHRQGAMLLAARDQLLEQTAQVIRQLNPRRITLLGGPSALTETVREQVRQAAADTTALRDGEIPDLIVSAVPTDGAPQALYAVTLEGRSEVMTNPPRRNADLAPNWSPGGTHIAWVRTGQAGYPDVEPIAYIMDYDEGVAEPVADADDCEEGLVLSPTWRQGTDETALLIACQHGDLRDPDSVDLTVATLDGETTDVVAPEDTTYRAGVWAPDGRLSVVARTDGDDEVWLLTEEQWTTGAAGELVTGAIDNINIMWVSAQGGDVLVHRDTAEDDDQQRLLSSIEGAEGWLTEELFRGQLEDNDGYDWEIWDVHADRGVILATERGGIRSGRGVADIVGWDGELTALVGPGDRHNTNANLIDPRFLPDGDRVLVGESRWHADRDHGVRSISDGVIRILDLETGEWTRFLGEWYFVIPGAVNPAGG